MTRIKTLGAVAALTVGALGFAPSAYAYDGCGWGYHQNAWGTCRPNYRPAYGGYYAPRPAYGYGYGYGYRPQRPGFSVSFRPF